MLEDSVTLAEWPHRRLNQLTGEWVLVSPHRMRRPWQGQQESASTDDRPEYDPNCYLCPGNKRAGGEVNPQYTATYVFTNDFRALLDGQPAQPTSDTAQTHSLLQSQPVRGTCRVVCFSPKHNVTLSEMPVGAVRRVVDVWCEQLEELGHTYRWVQIFENKGAIMGCSNPHPHGQIWAGDFIPNEATKELRRQQAYWQEHQRSLLVDYLTEECRRQERVVIDEEHWVVVVPFWAVWPFETLVLPRRPVQRLTDLTDEERTNLAKTLHRLLVRYDNLFQCSFPYSMGWHGAPTDGNDHPYWQLHAHFYPPLLRSATVKKFMVGYEMLGEPQRDLTPEVAAQRLHALSEVHYKAGLSCETGFSPES